MTLSQFLYKRIPAATRAPTTSIAVPTGPNNAKTDLPSVPANDPTFPSGLYSSFKPLPNTPKVLLEAIDTVLSTLLCAANLTIAAPAFLTGDTANFAPSLINVNTLAFGICNFGI